MLVGTFTSRPGLTPGLAPKADGRKLTEGTEGTTLCSDERSRSPEWVFWHNGAVRVAGKGRREQRLPLPADVGAALVAALRSRPPTSSPDVIFVTARSPYRQLSGLTVSGIAERGLRRAGVTVPRPGAHVFRHYSGVRVIPRLFAQGGRCSGWMSHWTRNNHTLFKKARTSSSGRHRFDRSCEGVVLAIAFCFSLRSACR